MLDAITLLRNVGVKRCSLKLFCDSHLLLTRTIWHFPSYFLRCLKVCFIPPPPKKKIGADATYGAARNKSNESDGCCDPMLVRKIFSRTKSLVVGPRVLYAYNVCQVKNLVFLPKWKSKDVKIFQNCIWISDRK